MSVSENSVLPLCARNLGVDVRRFPSPSRAWFFAAALAYLLRNQALNSTALNFFHIPCKVRFQTV